MTRRPPNRESRKRPARAPSRESPPNQDVSRARRSTYTIGKLAVLTKVSADALRYYEREDLLQPTAKSASGYRLYNEQAARRVQFIRHAQECGFTLAEIRGLLILRRQDSACCNDVRRLAIERKLQLEARIRSMKAMSTALDRLIAACDREELPVDVCPILIGLEQMETQS